ncbi:DAK2 domain-containing protein, partial [Streptomyces sp. NPDC058427]
ALAYAADGAWRGVRDTASLTARMGRASYLGERATGVPDPGAVGIALFFASAAGAVQALSSHLATG